MTVTHVVSKTSEDLQKQINEIISKPDCTLVDIKYSSLDRDFSALVICQFHLDNMLTDHSVKCRSHNYHCELYQTGMGTVTYLKCKSCGYETCTTDI